MIQCSVAVWIPDDERDCDTAVAPMVECSPCARINILHPRDKSHLSNLSEEVCGEALYPTLL